MGNLRIWITVASMATWLNTSACDDSSGGTSTDTSKAEEGRKERLTDAEIGAVTSAANTGEVAQGNAALPKLTNAKASAFATQMVEMHGAAQARQAALLAQKGIVPEENPVSAELKHDSDATLAALNGASAPVDQLYVDSQVATHQKVLQIMDEVLIPSATDADLLSELRAARADVKSHLDQAEALQSELAGS